MIRLTLEPKTDSKLQILCLGAHSDDIEIGCGGTVLTLIDRYPMCVFHWVVFSASGVRRAEAERAATLFAGSRLKRLVLKNFRDGYMPFVGGKIKDVFENLKQEVSPDIVFTHNGRDAHQDHRLLSELTWNTFRDHLILEYEIPKYDGDIGRPNVFVPLCRKVSQTKIEHLIDAFESQRSKHWFQESTFLSLMRLRGMECNSPSEYSEAFYCRKLVW
jgi:LmbE family N-acetylglucosaminyl deacetylase